VKRQLLVAVAVLRAPHAGDSGRARQPARLRDQAARLTGDDLESPAPHGGGRTGGHARSVTPRAAVAGRRRRRERPSDDDQRAVGPPGAERGMNLQPERPRSAEAGGATEPLKRDQWPYAEGEVHGMGGVAGLERGARGPRDRPLRVAVERVGRRLSGLRAFFKAIEERRSPRADDERSLGARQQLVEGERPRGDVERLTRQGEKDVEAQLAQLTRERRQQIVGRTGVRRLRGLRRAGAPT